MNCKNKYKKGSCCTDSERGCSFCNCGDESTALSNEGYYKLPSTDWMEDMPNVFPTDIFEIRFKNTRKSYYKNVNNLPLQKGDIVAVEASPGHDIGIVSLTGDIVAKQMKRVGFNPLNGEYKKIYRKAKAYDIEKWQESIALEHETMIASRQIVAELKLNMKIGDVEFQGDKIKAIFYYIADERVDFRELIKVLADQFSIRVEMKQIGARQEAGRIGGLGSCGRQLCCASWMSNFVSVTTNSARSQEISLNPQKLAGQCGKLKCCLVYELDSYIDARKAFPRINQPLQALDGEFYLFKNDILAGTMTFSTSPHSMIGLVTLPIRRVKEILEINKRGQKVDSMIDEKSSPKIVAEPSFVNMIEADSITRFDSTKRPNNKNRKRQNGDNKPRPGARTAAGAPSKPNPNSVVADSVVEKDASVVKEGQRPQRRRVNNSNRPQSNRVKPEQPKVVTGAVSPQPEVKKEVSKAPVNVDADNTAKSPSKPRRNGNRRFKSRDRVDNKPKTESNE